MSRIQQVLDKAEREGRVRRTISLDAAPAASPPSADAPVVPPVDVARPPAPRPAGMPRAVAAAAARTAARSSAAQAAPRPVAAVPSPLVVPTRTVDAKLHPFGIAALEPHSPVAEQYRALRTRIAQSENGQYYRAILVTSPSAGDGKSITSLNLALAMAQEFHRRVLLVDADLRNPSLHRLLGIAGRPGLSDVLSGTVPLDEAIVTIPSCRLAVIPAGSPVDQPAELLGSGEMRRLIDTLRTQFDRILLDTPPATPLADVGVLAPLADGVLLVVRAGRTSRPAIDRAIEDVDAGRIMGMVLNDVEETADGYNYGDPAAPPSAKMRRGERASG